MSTVLFKDVEVDGVRLDVCCQDAEIAAIGSPIGPVSADLVIPGGGGALVPGLHDHHIHLLATAAADNSVSVGPPVVRTRDDLRHVLAEADRVLPQGDWIRAVGYHESVAGELDADLLDRLVPARPVRVQHRSGALWVCNSAACQELGLIASTPDRWPPGSDPEEVRRGRLFRQDAWLRRALPDRGAPDLSALGARLARLGVTGVTDATPFDDLDTLAHLRCAALPQRLQLMGGLALASISFGPGVDTGPVKIIVTDHELPPLDSLIAWIRTCHDAGRRVAIHCVTAVALALGLAAWDEAGVLEGDRIEHGSVITEQAVRRVAELGLIVVTQPHFLAERGDTYLDEVDAAETEDLYRCGSLLRAGVRVAAGTDAPYGDLDPWSCLRAAVERRTPAGHVLGPHERVSPREALDLFLSPLGDPGGTPRRVRIGAPADLILLGVPLAAVLADPSADAVGLTMIGGRVAYARAG